MGVLSMLLCHKFPSLITLVLKDCQLNSDDLKNLAKAKVKGRLPEIKHLDISGNKVVYSNFDDFFINGCTWVGLKSLDTEQDISDSQGYILERFAAKVDAGFLPSMEELSVTTVNEKHTHQWMLGPWKRIRVMRIHTFVEGKNDILNFFRKAVQEGLFPSLEKVLIRQESSKQVKQHIKEATNQFVSELEPVLHQDDICYIDHWIRAEVESCFDTDEKPDISRMFEKLRASVPEKLEAFVSEHRGICIDVTQRFLSEIEEILFSDSGIQYNPGAIETLAKHGVQVQVKYDHEKTCFWSFTKKISER